MSALKVVHLLGAIYPSGMERMLASAAGDFAEHGLDSVVIGQGSVHPFAATLAQAGYRVQLIPRVRSLAGSLALYRVLRRESPDIVHVHTESAFLQAVLTSRLSSRAPIVRTIHSVFRPRGKASISRRVQSFFADKFVAQFVSPSPEVAENEAKWGRSSRLVFNWVSADYLQAGAGQQMEDRDPHSAVLVGNCAPVKNHEIALRALLSNGYSVSHHGDETNASPAEVLMLDELADAGRLLYRGTEAPLKSLVGSGVFVLPSRHEGMSVALAEAIAAGSPCLVADSTGLSWAKGIHGVQHVPLRADDWSAALPASGYVPLAGDVRTPDFSPKRGAEEYVGVYREAMGRSAASSDRK